MRSMVVGQKALFRRLMPAVLLGSLAACSHLPKVSPVADGAAATPVIISANGPQSPQASIRTLHEVQTEGSAALLKHHIDLLGPLGEFTSADNEVRLLVDGPATFKAMFSDLERARHSIEMESYIFEDATIGQRLGELLKRKAREGKEVRLIYDALGSLATSRAFFDDLAQAGVLICEFNPVHTSIPFRVDKLNHRDHRKMTIVDGRVAYTGGINVSDVYSAGSSSILKRKPADASADAEPSRGWRDTSVRVQGPAVTDFSILYADTWMRQGCSQAPPLAIRRPATRGERLVTVIGSTPADAEPRIYRALLTAIGGARRSVHMTMSYFVPDPQTSDFLVAAAQRGVEVTLVLQGKSDSELVLRAGQSYYQQLLAAGVKIYERTDTLLHAKTAVIDGVWSSVGSSNVDWRSFLHNDEVNVIVFGADFGNEMEALFERDVARSRQITPESWQTRGAWRRLQEQFGRLFEYWL